MKSTSGTTSTVRKGWGGARPGSGRKAMKAGAGKKAATKVKPKARAKATEKPAKPRKATPSKDRPTGAVLDREELGQPASPKDGDLSQRVLTSKDFQEILDLCKSNGVARIRLGEVEIQFGQAITQAKTQPVEGAEALASVSSEKSSVSLGNTQALDEAEETQRMIDDPVGFEQSQIDAHLTQESSNGGGTHGREA